MDQTIYRPDTFLANAFAYTGKLGRKQADLIGSLVQLHNMGRVAEVDEEQLTVQGWRTASRLVVLGFLSTYVDARSVQCFNLNLDRVSPCGLL